MASTHKSNCVLHMKANSIEKSVCSNEHEEEVTSIESRLKQLIARMRARQCTCADVMIVDDNIFNIIALQSHISTFGLTTDTALSGKIAEKKWQELYDKKCCYAPKIVFMDLEMPGQNGYEVTKKMLEFLNSKSFSTIIVAATGHQNEEEKSKCLKSGF